VTSFFLTIW